MLAARGSTIGRPPGAQVGTEGNRPNRSCGRDISGFKTAGLARPQLSCVWDPRSSLVSSPPRPQADASKDVQHAATPV